MSTTFSFFHLRFFSDYPTKQTALAILQTMRVATKTTITMANTQGRRLTDRPWIPFWTTPLRTWLLSLMLSAVLLTGQHLLVFAQESVTASSSIVCMTDSDCGPEHRCLLPSLATPETGTGHCQPLNVEFKHAENEPTVSDPAASTTPNSLSSPVVSFINSLTSASSDSIHTFEESPTVEHSVAASEPAILHSAASETDVATEKPVVVFRTVEPLSVLSPSHVTDKSSALTNRDAFHSPIVASNETDSVALAREEKNADTTPTTTATTTTTTTTTTLPPASSCKDRPCRNRGRCKDNPNGTYICSCRDGYYGDRCQFTHCGRCDHGRCLAEETEDDQGNFIPQFRCYCRPGFSGKSCDEDVNECLHQSCGNGTCVNLPGTYRCDCPTGFEGTHCEHEIDECTLSPCKNGANCTNLIGSYRCDCPTGYEGKNCERDINECADHPCLNKGKQMFLKRIFRWVWKDDELFSWMSDVLKNIFKSFLAPSSVTRFQSVGPVYDSNPLFLDSFLHSFFSPLFMFSLFLLCACRNDFCCFALCAGVCVDQIASFRCECPSGFDGARCEHNIDDCADVHCEQGARCEDLVNDFKCHCPKGWVFIPSSFASLLSFMKWSENVCLCLMLSRYQLSLPTTCIPTIAFTSLSPRSLFLDQWPHQPQLTQILHLSSVPQIYSPCCSNRFRSAPSPFFWFKLWLSSSSWLKIFCLNAFFRFPPRNWSSFWKKLFPFFSLLLSSSAFFWLHTFNFCFLKFKMSTCLSVNQVFFLTLRLFSHSIATFSRSFLTLASISFGFSLFGSNFGPVLLP